MYQSRLHLLQAEMASRKHWARVSEYPYDHIRYMAVNVEKRLVRRSIRLANRLRKDNDSKNTIDMQIQSRA